MSAIFIKEIKSFFSSLTGYIAAIVFLAIFGLILWVFPGQFNILDNQYSTLDSLFYLAPWFFLFLVPAVTMKAFADEKKSGTLELILTKPISDINLIMGKYLASVVLILIILLPSLIFYLSVFLLGNPIGNIDTGGTWGSFIGLFFLATAYVSIGIFASSFTDNQIVSFIIAMVISFVVYLGFDSIASLESFSGMKYFITNLGINEHYNSMSRGVIDTRDLLYFICISLVFLFATRTVIQSRKW